MREGWGGATVSSVKVSIPDATDNQIAVQSTCGQTHRLPRGFSDEFSFGVTDLVILVNTGGDRATVSLQPMLTPQDALYIGSTRRAGYIARGRQSRTHRMQPGEVITIRSLYAVEPGSRGRVPIHPGQVTPT
jgi:hypothetical protein